MTGEQVDAVLDWLDAYKKANDEASAKLNKR